MEVAVIASHSVIKSRVALRVIASSRPHRQTAPVSLEKPGPWRHLAQEVRVCARQPRSFFGEHPFGQRPELGARLVLVAAA
ncbi:hypothetical protein QF027_006534 [Streptomyces canus]|nr:hypothetical protein [Streptomyces canus]